MNIENIKIEFLKESIRKAEEERSSFSREMNISKKQVIVNSFQNHILTVLDNIYTSLPVDDTSEIGQYFPRVRPLENRTDYLSRISNIARTVKPHPQFVIDFYFIFLI